MSTEQTANFWREVEELQINSEIEFLKKIRLFYIPYEGIDFNDEVPAAIREQVQEILQRNNIA